MIKTQVYLAEDELAALRESARRSGRSMAEIIREAVRGAVFPAAGDGLVAIWDGPSKRSSDDHDSIYDEP